VAILFDPAQKIGTSSKKL